MLCQYHGANRLGGNSLLGALYGGRVAAKSACEQADVVDLSCATQIDFPPASQISEIKQLNKVMQDTMGVVRNENTLLNGIQNGTSADRKSSIAWHGSSKECSCKKRKPWCTLAGGLSEEQ